jgi:hypothetical protein
MAETVREQIMQAIETSFKAVVVDANYSFAWSLVERAPLRKDMAQRKTAALSIYDPTEEKQPAMGNMKDYFKIHVVLEWTFLVDKALAPATAGNRVIGALKRRLMEDPQWNGLALNTMLLADSYSVQDAQDRQIEGEMDIEVLYRCDSQDPTRL